MTASAPVRTIGVFGAAITIVGFVVGASIYILPGAIASSAGPGVVLSYAIASVLALFSCVVAAQIGVVFPTSGASFIAIGRLVSPFAGFVCIWMIIGAAAVAIALLGFGFADYMATWLPEGNRWLMGLGVIVLMALINLAGVRETLIAQFVMVALFTLGLLMFSGAGLWQSVGSGHLVPFLPNGLRPAVAGAIPAFFSYAGFMIIIEMAGEIKNPGRSIPVALAISFLVVLALYSVTALALVALVPWHQLADINAPIAMAAAIVLPAPLAAFVSFTALAATVSSINVMLMGYSRDVYMLARGGIFPRVLAKTSTRRGVPVGGILALTVAALVSFSLSAKITEYATFVVVGLLILQIGLGAAAFRLASSQEYLDLKNTFRLPPIILRVFAAALFVLSLAFGLIVLQDSPATAAISTAYLGIGVIYYFWRRKALAESINGIQL